jgi:hypothetical protein
MPLVEAVAAAKPFVTRAIAEHFAWEREGGTVHALNHFQQGGGK